MKRFLKAVCMLLVAAVLLSVPVFAEQEATTWASDYFTCYSTYLHRTTGTRFEIWFDVVACGTMTELGVSEIELQRSYNGGAWTTIMTYTPEYYPQMLCENTASHGDCVSYYGTAGYDYRAYVTFYAKKGTGSAERYVYAYFLYE